MNETKPNEKAITVSQIVRQDYRTADVFKKWGINYCCGGALPLAEACALKEVDMQILQQELDAVARTVNLWPGLQFGNWPIDFLIDYITHVHHEYLKQTLPALGAQLRSFVASHKKQYPYLQAVEEVFNDLAAELAEHNQKEEEKIFPYLKQVTVTYKRRETYGALFVRTLGKPLDQQVGTEHKRIAALLTQLRKVTNDYQFGHEACTNHQVVYHKLKELDADLMQHKHLENNILFPKVLQMEQELLQTV